MWLALLLHTKKALGSNLGQRLSVWSLHVLLGFTGFFPYSQIMQHGNRLIDDSKLLVYVNMSVDCLFVSICEPCDELTTCLGCPLPLPVDAEIGPRNP